MTIIHLTASSFLRAPRRLAAAAGFGLAATACVLAPAGAAAAVVTPLPYTSVAQTGDASQQPSNNLGGVSAGATAPGGVTSQFLVTTESVSGDGTTVSGTSAVPVGSGNLPGTLAYDTYLDPAQIAYNAGNAGTEGSALEFTLTVQPGHQAIQFNYDFATAEDVGQPDAHPDFAFYSLTPVDSSGVAIGATTFGLLGSAGDAASGFAPLVDPLGNSPFNVAEGYKTGNTGNLPSGTYVLALGVADADTTDTQSGLFIANVVTVPEPGVTAFVMLAVGAGAVWAWRGRRGARAGA